MSTEGNSPSTSTEGGSLLVLIADDDNTTRRLLEKTIAKWGYRPLAVDDGAKAWEILQVLPVHVLLTDWDMPGLTGLELCERIRQSNRDRYTYVLMLTHHEDQSRIVKALETGADDFVSKPFDARVLRARLKVAARIVTLESQLRRSQRRLEAANLVLAQQATTDVLTGLGNRRAFDEALARTHAWALESHVPYALALCDVDKFKAYNDHYGHQAGDKVLSTVSGVLQESLRAGDSIYRYGGEEIVVVLPRCRHRGLRTAAERLRFAVQTVGIEHVGGGAGVVTVSVGGAVFDPDLDLGTKSEDVLRRADEALYRAKAEGRNRVVVETPPLVSLPPDDAET